jgi:hypothetical protein
VVEGVAVLLGYPADAELVVWAGLGDMLAVYDVQLELGQYDLPKHSLQNGSHNIEMTPLIGCSRFDG